MEGYARIAPSIPAWRAGTRGLGSRDTGMAAMEVRGSVDRSAHLVGTKSAWDGGDIRGSVDPSACALGSRDTRMATMEVRGSVDRSAHLVGTKSAWDGVTRGDRSIQVHGSVLPGTPLN